MERHLHQAAMALVRSLPREAMDLRPPLEATKLLLQPADMVQVRNRLRADTAQLPPPNPAATDLRLRVDTANNAGR